MIWQRKDDVIEHIKGLVSRGALVMASDRVGVERYRVSDNTSPLVLCGAWYVLIVTIEIRHVVSRDGQFNNGPILCTVLRGKPVGDAVVVVEVRATYIDNRRHVGTGLKGYFVRMAFAFVTHSHGNHHRAKHVASAELGEVDSVVEVAGEREPKVRGPRSDGVGIPQHAHYGIITDHCTVFCEHLYFYHKRDDLHLQIHTYRPARAAVVRIATSKNNRT